MREHWIPIADSYVILDTNICSHLLNTELDGNLEYFEQMNQLIDEMLAAKIKIVVPQIVSCELLRKAKDKRQYSIIDTFLRQYYTHLLSPETVDAASKLQSLYIWSKNKKKNDNQEDQKKGNSPSTVFFDMIIGVTVAIMEHQTKMPTYLLSGDQDFREPYFTTESYYLLGNPERKKAQYFYLYSIEREKIKKDWNTASV